MCALLGGRFDSIVAENGYKAYMKLKIRDVQPEDFGTYGCSAKNSFGESNGTIKVYGNYLYRSLSPCYKVQVVGLLLRTNQLMLLKSVKIHFNLFVD